ncbi:MAG TPA: uroporphyrinogen decarboxylase family protein [Bryobacteraceae bacterium]|nr:uroporphyrinogen decarboxylase family protein [Bryobacteraceae bacterium]
MLTPEARLRTAVSGGVPDRVPVVPKIFIDSAARLTGTPLLDAIEDPATALRVIYDAGLLAQVDAVRQFHCPARRTGRDGERVYEVDARGRRIGEIDMSGGLTTRLFDAAELNLEDPCRMAYLQWWTAEEPYVRTLEDVKRIAVPERKMFEQLGCGERQREVMRRAGEGMAIIGDCISATLCFVIQLRGYQNALFDLVEQPALVHAIMEKGVEFATERGKFNVDLGLKVLRLNDSAGNCSVISPAHWREFVFPHLKEVCDELHRYDPEVRIYSHICGNVLPVIDDLVEAGIDCIGPLDPLGRFTAKQAREKAGDRVALMGGVNTLSFLNEDPAGIAAEARACIEGAGARGGYVLGSGCMIPPSSRLENLLALAETARRYGTYSEA